MTKEQEASIIVWIVLRGYDTPPKEFTEWWNDKTHERGWRAILISLEKALS